MNLLDMDVGALKERLHEMRLVEGINTIALPRDEFIELESKLRSYHVFYAPNVTNVPKVDQIFYSGTTIYPLDEVDPDWEPEGEEVGYEENNDQFKSKNPFEDMGFTKEEFDRMSPGDMMRIIINYGMRTRARKKGWGPKNG